MKRIIIALALLGLISYEAKAQAGSLQVSNPYSCTIYVRIFGGPIGACNGSGGGPIISSLIPIPPGGAFFPNPSTIPGFPGGGGNFIFGAWPYASSNPSCSTQMRRVGEPCSGLTTTNPILDIFSPACTVCVSVIPNWTVAPGVGGMAILSF